MPTTAQPGDVVLVRFPFTDLTTTKLRPAVVLSTHGDDLTIVGIFSGLPQAPRETWIPLSTGEPAFAQTGLKTSSVIKAERIAVIEESVVVRKPGSLTPARMREVRRAVKRALNLD
jgi:mRNA interferase MazF